MTDPTRPPRATPRATPRAKPWASWTRWTRWALAGSVVAALGLGSLATAAPPTGDAGESTSADIELSRSFDAFFVRVDAWDLDEARAQIPDLPNETERELARGVLALYEARYEDAESTLAGVVASLADADDNPIAAQARHYLEVARGAQLALGDAIEIRSEDGRFEAVFADRKDALLAPYLFEAMAVAYDQLGEDIGVRPEHPIRFEFYDEPGKLALVTPLTLDNIYTTGTVGICKYRRIMMVTPRVMFYGYGWLDTAVHEYVHYVLTMRTNNNAPVWMQEGTAKLMEARWRGEDGSQLEPPIRALLHDALRSGELVTLEQMHPSVAMLPTQEMAALAYAEAETMLGLLEEERGREGMAELMDQVEDGVDAKVAFAGAWGDDFDAFFEHWQRTMTARTAEGPRGGSVSDLAFRDADAGPDSDAEVDPSLAGDVFSHLGGGKASQHARLGVLLTMRGHERAAIIEYEKARAAERSARDDPKLARRLGELYLKVDRAPEALPLLILAAEDDPDNANIAAAEARARRLTGDPEGAREALDRAIRKNPFIPGIHCDLAALAMLDGDQATADREADLCED